MTAEDKRKARQLAQLHIPIDGPCAKCGGLATDRHHPDHGKPLEVVFLCKSCHRDADYEIHKAVGTASMAKKWADRSKVKKCENCGKDFTYKRPRETSCSAACGNKLAWVGRRQKIALIGCGCLETESIPIAQPSLSLL